MKNLHFIRPTFYFSDDPDAGGSTGGNNGDGGNGGEKPKDEKKSYTQAELDAMFADRAKQARSSTIADILKTLGVEKLDDAKALVEAKRQADEAQKSELEKAQDAIKKAEEKAAQALADAEKFKAEANERLLKAEVVRLAGEVGFRPEAAGDVWLVIDRSKISQEETGDFKGVKEAVELIAKEKPFWLVDPSGQKKSGGTPKPNLQTKPQANQGNNQNNDQPNRIFTL
ncbi:hypothetical protein [Ornatilinea apprima]|uniref:hypothetical protein n=1 Tax=Ornatilinea apprima TaxID=1134406 RepID=UPI00094646A4|nr:hypothetical protein [Ornatilinea apprima]